MTNNADQEIKERENRLRNVQVDLLPAVWIRELTNEITRLRHDLRERLPLPEQGRDAP
jgi:hypothetical protein